MNLQSCLKERAFNSPWGGGFNARLLGENHYKINSVAIEGLLLNEVVVSFCGSLLTPPC